jgi:hypothetical protein
MLLTTKKRKRQHNVRLNAEEMKRSKKLQAHYDVGFSTLVRMLMKEKERELEKAETAETEKSGI